MKEHRRRATDHRALVLEVVATTPDKATRDAVQREVLRCRTDDRFGVNQISAMVSTLLREGLLGRRDDDSLFVTSVGLDWLHHATFDLPLPKPYTKTSRRKPGGAQ